MSIPTINELETMTPDQLGELLRSEVDKNSPDFHCIDDILTVGCPIDYRTIDGLTALHMAAMYGKLEVVEFLLHRGAELDVRDKWGRTALHCAAVWGHLEMVKFLISKGAEVNARDKWGGAARRWTLRPDIRAMLEELEAK